MKKKSVVTGSGITGYRVVIGGMPKPTPAPEPAGGPSMIPHSLDGKDDCLMCRGDSGIKPFPTNHAGRTVASCTGCHQAS